MTLLGVSVLGPDHPGIIAALTEGLLGEEGNLQDATMTLLRGHFAMILVVATPVPMATVAAGLTAIGEVLGLTVSVRELHEAAPEPLEAPGTWSLRVYGADRPGIVAAMTRCLAAHDANITEVSTRLAGDLFVFLATVELPATTSGAALDPELRAIAGELGVEAAWEPAGESVL